ncbi:uncharacterized protein KIAA2012 homolog [Leptodactylus fuscus]|uniref:uncharacterized protein KIAA2012 homolog n=1 Tax=Leptodactylus fuscus TaxID=238119 RepID=UPI003F4EC750
MSTLSLLSRGNAQVVRTTQEKLVVYYEPQDYFNWKSRQDYHIRQFLSSRYTSNHYWAVPTHKTYSTRKGALVLFSEDLALPAWKVSQDRRLKRRYRYKRKNYQIELSTLQDLTGAILSYGRKQDHVEPHWQPYLHFLNEEDVRYARQIRPGYSPKRYLTRLFRTWDPNTVYKLQQAGSLRDSVQLQQLTSSGDGNGRHPDLSSTPLKYHRLPVFTSLPYWSNTDAFTSPGRCTPVEEETGNEEQLAYEREILEIYGKNSTLPNTATFRKSSPEQRPSQVTQSSWKVKEQINSHMGEAQQTQASGNDMMTSLTDRHEKPPAPVDVSFLKDNYAPNQGKPHTTFYGGPFAGRRKYPHSKLQKDYTDLPAGGFLPPISQSLGPEAEVLKDPNTKVQESLKLPRIIEEPSKIPQRRRRRQATDPPKELLVIPLLVHFENQRVNQEDQTGKDDKYRNGMSDSNNEEPAGGRSKSDNGFNVEQMDPLLTSEVSAAAAENRCKTIQMDIEWNLDPNPDGDLLAPEVPPLGLLPPINGKKGPGNQSSMANVKATNASNSASAINAKGLPTGIIRGSLPEELKECCRGSSVGSLIMGPDGEIVCLSLMGATRDADIPIRFDFIPEEEEEEEEIFHLSSVSEQDNVSERGGTPPHRKVKKGKKSPVSETSWQDESSEVSARRRRIVFSSSSGDASIEFGQYRLAEKIHKGHKGDVRSGQKKDKPSKLTAEESDQRIEDTEERNSRTRSPEQEGKHSSAETDTEDGDEAFSTSTEDFQDQNIEEEDLSDQNLQIQADTSRNTPEKEPLDSSILQNKSDQVEEHEHERNQKIKRIQDKQKIQNEAERKQCTEKENLQLSPDATNMEAKSHHKNASGREDTTHVPDTTDSDPAAPSTGQDQYHSKKSVQVKKGSGKQANLKHKTTEVTKMQKPKPSDIHENNPEILKDVETVPSERKENLSVNPQQAEVTQESGHTEKQQLTEEEELALLQEITNTVTKEAGKGKGKKKAKSEKVQKTEKAQTSRAKKANQKAGAEQGKAVFVVGQPRNKKAESNISYPKKTSEQVKVQETIHEIPETPEKTQEEEEDNDTERESEDSYVIEYHERTPTPTPFDDIPPESERGVSPETSDQVSEQAAATLEVTSQTNEDDYSYSETSEVTSSSVRQRRSSRVREISEKAERRRLEVERKRREREEQLRLEKEQQERLDKMKEEFEQEQMRRAEELRLRRKEEEEERQRQEQERARRMQLEQQALERARQQQEEHRRKLQEIQRRKQQEDLERIESERQRQNEKERLEAEERMRLLEMEAEEREEYLRKKREREEQARREAEERRLKAEEEARSIMEEAQRQAELLARQTAALEQQLKFNRGLLKESVGLDQTQGISRPWVFSYYEFLELLGIPLPVEGE